MAPEFAEMLLTIPREERDGRVFGLNYTRKDGVSKVVSDIGAKAGVKVDSKRTADPETPKVKYASAHDLRRSFGERWAMRPDIMPQVLMQLMRHESIETTMRYYVGKNAEMVADVLWKAVGNTSSNSLLVATSDSIGELSQQATHKEEVKTESYSSPIKTTDSGSVATSRRRTPRARSPGAPPAAEESSVGGTKVAVLSVSRKPEKSTGICLIVIEPNR
jgi:hypothetical protein